MVLCTKSEGAPGRLITDLSACNADRLFSARVFGASSRSLDRLDEQALKVRRIDFYPDDWIAGTIGLNHFERSVYISICAGIYSTGGWVSIDYVRRICPGKGFNQGLAGLIKGGKVSQEGRMLGVSRALKELERSASRADKWAQNLPHSNKTNGFDGSRASETTRVRTRDNHQSSFNNQHYRDSQNGFRKVGDTLPPVPELPTPREPPPKD